MPDAVFALAGDGPERGAAGSAWPASSASPSGSASSAAARTSRSCSPPATSSRCPRSTRAPRWPCWRRWRRGGAVVSSAIGGTDELIEDGRSGLLVPPGDADGRWRRPCGGCWATPELRETLAARARERVERDFTREPMAAPGRRHLRRAAGRWLTPGRRRRADCPRRGATRCCAGSTGASCCAAARLPRVLDLAPGRDSAGAAAGLRGPAGARRGADLAVIGFPTTRGLRLGASALCARAARSSARWRLPRLGGARRARSGASRAAGFLDVGIYWPGPLPHRPPQFWLPLESARRRASTCSRSARRALRRRPLLRRLWRCVARAGLLAPLYADRPRRPGAGERGPPARADSLLLLTGGHRSINKVVGLRLRAGGPRPARGGQVRPRARGRAGPRARGRGARPAGGGAARARGRPAAARRGARRAAGWRSPRARSQGDSLLDALTPAELRGDGDCG